MGDDFRKSMGYSKQVILKNKGGFMTEALYILTGASTETILLKAKIFK